MRLYRLALALVVLSAPVLSAQGNWTTKFTIIKGGKDTLGVESFTREGGSLSGQLVQSSGVRTEYIANLRADQSIEHIEFQRTNAQNQSATFSIDFADTLVSATVTAADKTTPIKLAVPSRPNAYLVNSLALFEQICKSNPVEVGKSKRVIVVRLGAGDTATVTISRVHADSVVVDAPNGAMRMAINKEGDVIGAIFPSQQWVIERKKM